MRILLVEDEPKVSAFVARGLIAERYAVDISADGREGLGLARPIRTTSSSSTSCCLASTGAKC